MHNAPDTAQLQFDVPECAGTEHGHACMTLRFSSTDAVRESSKRPLKGTLHWALYKGGDVGLLGPGKHPSLLSGDWPNADLTGDAPIEITLPNVEAREYQALAYLDETLSNTGDASSGDAVTFPGEPFAVRSDAHTRVAVVLDFIR